MKNLRNKVVYSLMQYGMVQDGMRVCVCLSGGADSSVLLHVLHQLQEELRITLSACHFNHGIRGEEADRDENFCRLLCAKYDIPFYVTKADLPASQPNSGLSMEEYAREKRYQWFSSLRELYGIHRFALAHHQSDNAETVLFHAVRGTTVSGLAGIPPVRDCYVRPLLSCSKEEILAYAVENGLSFVEDSTNSSLEFTRNYIRLSLFPALEKINPSVTEALCRLSRYASEDDAFLSSLLPPYSEKQDCCGLSVPLIRRTVSRNFQKICGSGLCYQHLDTIVDAVLLGICSVINVPGGYQCRVEQGSFCFVPAEKPVFPPLEPNALQPGETRLCQGMLQILHGKNGIFIGSEKDTKFVYNLSTEILLSSKGICGMIRYRSRLPGDRLRIKGVNRSVKKLMSESKIPVFLRDSLPVFFDDGGVIAVPFVGVADRVYVPGGETGERIQIYIAEPGV